LSIVLQIERGQSKPTLQRQLYLQIREAIVSATFHPGMPMPSSRTLAEDLGVSRNTVVMAFELLINEGYLQTTPGVGTFVTNRLPESCIAADTWQGGANEPITETSAKRPRTVFRGERLRFIEKGPHRPSIDFWYGSPNQRHFPLKAWRQILIDNISRTSTNLSHYGSPAGNLELRQAIAEHLGATRGVRAVPEQIIITAGAQEGINLVCRLLIEPGVRVAVENPCYGGAARTFSSYGAMLVPIEVDNDGLDLAALEQEEAATLAYVTPSHQFPTGVTLTIERRRRLLSWATKVGAYVIEDDYDGEFRYDGPPIAALAGLDSNGCVLYLGTFSKSIGAGLRLGFIVVPEHLIGDITAIKSLMNYGHPWLDQIVMAEFIKSGGYRRHLREIRELYRIARDALVGSLKRHFGDQYIFGKYSGMHLMWTLPPSLAPAQNFAALALSQDVGIYTLEAVGAVDFTGVWQTNNIVLGYSSLSTDKIEIGIKRIADAHFAQAAGQRAKLGHRCPPHQ
jgi:GntR family transcriptional regulator / MocR family aminotransferase